MPEIPVSLADPHWRSHERRGLLPIAEEAVALAEDFLHDEQILYDDPISIDFRRCYNASTLGGDSGQSDINIFVCARDIKKFNNTKKFTPVKLGIKVVHELCHVVRNEYQGYKLDAIAPFAYAADEGLAYSLENDYALQKGIRSGMFSAVMNSPLSTQQAREQFMMLYRRGRQNRKMQPQILNQMLGKKVLKRPPPAGLVWGIRCVQEHKAEGVAMADMLHMPTKEILRISRREDRYGHETAT